MKLVNLTCSKIPNYSGEYQKYIEMTYKEQEFVLKLLRRYNPSKILEVGVARGGTSVQLLKHSNADVYSVDINEKYGKEAKKIGYLVDDFCSETEKARHYLYAGKDLIYVLDKIGNDFDFVILDTMHRLPGELLTIFILNKIMKNASILILHDINLNMNYAIRETPISLNCRDSYATSIIFSTLSSDLKFLPYVQIPNIGGMVIDETTRINFYNIFFVLNYPWNYYPSDLIPSYKEYIYDNYEKFFADYFSKHCDLQKNLVENFKHN